MKFCGVRGQSEECPNRVSRVYCFSFTHIVGKKRDEFWSCGRSIVPRVVVIFPRISNESYRPWLFNGNDSAEI
ncbi:hypothetical protein IQ07DRAFT_302596 [Pyrenochaeta sp. DS3sAY3a]|nr:hypothetical protein IQ07DRAFT_302596 [Pyrenochaeta sp. DS3sAY3a]